MAAYDSGSAVPGTRPSELDEPDGVDAAFVELRDRVGTIVAQYQRGELPEADALAALARQTLEDDEGGQWTVGASTLRYFHRPAGGQWSPTAPPRLEQGPADDVFDQLFG